MEQQKFLILPPMIRPTTTCINRTNCNQTIEFFRDICLGTLDLDERKNIADKVVVKLEEFGTQIEKEDWDILNHYINNLLLAYTTMAIEYKRRT